MLRLKSKCLEFSVSLLISKLALGVFLLLQFEDLLEWGLGDGSGDFVLAVKVLHNCRLAWVSRAMQFPIHMQVSRIPSTYHFAQKEDVLAAHEEDSARDIRVKTSSVDSLNCVL